MSFAISDVTSHNGLVRFSTKSIGRSAFVLFSIMTIITVSCAAYDYYLFNKEKKLARSVTESDQRATRLTVELVALQKQVEIDVMQVQRSLTDFGAAKTADDRLQSAKAPAERLSKDIYSAVQVADMLGSPEVVAAFKEVESRFPAFYAVGQEIARSHMESDGGGAIRERFDAAGGDLQRQIAATKFALDGEMEKNISQSNFVNADIDRLRDFGTTVSLLNVFVVVLTCISGIFITLYWVTQPLKWITFVFKELAHGRLDWATHEVSRPDEIGDLARVYSEFRQITVERQQALKKVAEQQNILEVEQRHTKLLADRFDSALSNMLLGLVMLDENRQLLVQNQRLAELLGLPSASVRVGGDMYDLLLEAVKAGTLTDEGVKKLGSALEKLASRKDKEELLVETTGGRVLEFGFQPMSSSGALVLVEDITEKSSAQSAVKRLAYFDSLTELPNRRSFVDGVERALAEMAEKELFALLFIDLDHFKQINDSQGHGAGDELLRGVAERLTSLIRKNDIVARLGGDEFVILQRDVRRVKDIMSLAQRIIDAFREPFMVAGQEVRVGTSIGIARSPRNGLDRDTLMRNADTALYRAKASGRNTWRFFKPVMHDEIVARAELERDLRQAVAEGTLEVYFQPIMHAEGEQISAFEALLRWPHPERGMVSPVDFIPLAEDTGLIVEIGALVIERACQACAAWPEHIRVAVNLSAIQFRRGDLVSTIEHALKAAGMDPHRLDVEITESILLQDSDNVRHVLKRLRDLGVTVSLDDFGTGYSSLSYLHSFPLDRIKIDRSFLRKAVSSEKSLTLLQGMIRMSLDLKLGLVVEGVETREQLSLVRDKCAAAEVQGFLFSPAIPEMEVADFMERARSQRAA
jgi:diguanylate cyclase (GGDEF)-like protein